MSMCLVMFFGARRGGGATLAVGVDGKGSLEPLAAGALLPVAMVARAANGASTSGSWVQTPELIPTRLRGFGSGTCLAANAVGNMAICYWVWDSGYSYFYRALGVAFCGAAAAALAALLPETAGTTLTEGSPARARQRPEARLSKLWQIALSGVRATRVRRGRRARVAR